MFVLFIVISFYGFLRLFYSSAVLIFISLIIWQPFCFFTLCWRRFIQRPFTFWHFHFHSNTTYNNLWIFRMIIKNFQKSNIAHIVGNNSARMLLLASWHCCYWFGASNSWSVAVFFVFQCDHMFVNLFIPIFGVYSITCSQFSGVAHIIFRYQVCDI